MKNHKIIKNIYEMENYFNVQKTSKNCCLDDEI
jgi:hypothetical protein